MRVCTCSHTHASTHAGTLVQTQRWAQIQVCVPCCSVSTPWAARRRGAAARQSQQNEMPEGGIQAVRNKGIPGRAGEQPVRKCWATIREGGVAEGVGFGPKSDNTQMDTTISAAAGTGDRAAHTTTRTLPSVPNISHGAGGATRRGKVVSLRKAHRELGAELDAALEGRTVRRRDEEERRARTIKLEESDLHHRGGAPSCRISGSCSRR